MSEDMRVSDSPSGVPEEQRKGAVQATESEKRASTAAEKTGITPGRTRTSTHLNPMQSGKLHRPTGRVRWGVIARQAAKSAAGGKRPLPAAPKEQENLHVTDQLVKANAAQELMKLLKADPKDESKIDAFKEKAGLKDIPEDQLEGKATEVMKRAGVKPAGGKGGHGGFRSGTVKVGKQEHPVYLKKYDAAEFNNYQMLIAASKDKGPSLLDFTVRIYGKVEMETADGTKKTYLVMGDAGKAENSLLSLMTLSL